MVEELSYGVVLLVVIGALEREKGAEESCKVFGDGYISDTCSVLCNK